ncbi:hypothetical protein [Nonomuraea phyllanthi]|uniref:hypothetical protein n=1 Tax=Nonomuraea phyllanthi TaxID=2219224 RepID=UPI001293ACEA|nr:hypothetical protein [Nonomuraea phyllanthi]
MNQKAYLRMMLVVTVAYGVLIALLAMFGVGGIGVVAIVGGIIVGLGWALTGVLAKRDPTT